MALDPQQRKDGNPGEGSRGDKADPGGETGPSPSAEPSKEIEGDVTLPLKSPPPIEPGDLPTVLRSPGSSDSSGWKGSVVTWLRSHQRRGGHVSLPSEDAAEEMVAGPASEHRYRVLGEIARGGMGAVLRLMDNDIRRIVAMKVNLAREDWERLERFVEEAQITGQLEHPNIVPIHELGLNDQGEIYFTMKWVKGKSLDWIHDRLADRDPGISPKYPLSHRLQIFLKVCDAMAFAHNRGV
ncbi:MAG: protein kinase domain-containing protein, partial [Planctomycetota bacterium]